MTTLSDEQQKGFDLLELFLKKGVGLKNIEIDIHEKNEIFLNNFFEEGFFIKGGDNLKIIRKYNNFFMLTGGGGVGKTFLIRKFINKINEDNKIASAKHYNFKVLAPTHKAVGVLKKGIGHDVQTLAKFLGYAETYDEDGEKVISYNTKKEIGLDFIIVDECSMLTLDQINALISKDLKIIFLGDSYQIGPINEECSVSNIFNLCDINYELKKNQRTLNDKILDIIQIFRHNVDLRYIQRKSIDHEFRTTSRKTFDQELISSFYNENTDNTISTVFIAYTNLHVQKY
jgi:AAA+ ATPase superfamily predicted ATPase